MARPLKIETQNNLTVLTGNKKIAVSTDVITSSNLGTNIGSLSLNLSDVKNRILIDGVIPVAINYNLPSGAANYSVNLQLAIYRNTTSTTPIYTISRTVLQVTGIGNTIDSATNSSIIPFKFVDIPSLAGLSNEYSYFFNIGVLSKVGNITINNINVNNSSNNSFNITAKEIAAN